jgi:hypothetical protein
VSRESCERLDVDRTDAGGLRGRVEVSGALDEREGDEEVEGAQRYARPSTSTTNPSQHSCPDEPPKGKCHRAAVRMPVDRMGPRSAPVLDPLAAELAAAANRGRATGVRSPTPGFRTIRPSVRTTALASHRRAAMSERVPRRGHRCPVAIGRIGAPQVVGVWPRRVVLVERRERGETPMSNRSMTTTAALAH